MVLEIFGSLLISSGLVGMLMQPRKRDEGKIILDILNANNIFRKRQYSVMGKKGEETIKPKIVKIDRLESFVRYYITLPRGISHLEVKKLATELSEGLNKEISISYDYFTIIDVFNEKLSKNIPFDDSLINKNDYKVPLGKNMKGEIVYLDLTGKFSHLIVGGISGAGKSQLVHLILTMLSIKETPPDIYISDLKYGVELQDYKEFRHVKGFVTTLEDLEVMLDDVIAEMKRRYIILLQNKSRQWKGYPAVVIIDEMIDIKSSRSDDKYMKELKGSIKEKLTAITAKGRAARVYLIAATQRPDYEVIDGIIKTNISNTIGFKTRDDVQSRIILDNTLSAKLEYIPGRAYFQQSEDVLIQTFYLSEEKEVELLKAVPKRVIDIVATNTEDRQMDANTYDIKQIGLFDNDTDSNVIQLAERKHVKNPKRNEKRKASP